MRSCWRCRHARCSSIFCCYLARHLSYSSFVCPLNESSRLLLRHFSHVALTSLCRLHKMAGPAARPPLTPLLLQIYEKHLPVSLSSTSSRRTYLKGDYQDSFVFLLAYNYLKTYCTSTIAS